MAQYKVTVFTGSMVQAGTMNKLYIKLVGAEGESDHRWLANLKGGFYQGAADLFTVCCSAPLGRLLLVELDKKPLPLMPQDAWFCSKVTVETPEGETAHFPVYRWISDLEKHLFREGTAYRVFDEKHPLAIYCREKELKSRLLIPHTRYTLQINFLARLLLISKDGVFTQFAASGGEGMFTILQRAVSSLTYSSLCLPEDIAARGLESIPNFYYRDDGLRLGYDPQVCMLLWDMIHRLVQGVIGHYYKSDFDVQQDSELQNWIKDIFIHGFLSRASSGVPQSLDTVKELVKIVTVAIFTGSAQHSAVNSGQFDYGSWMPNTPITLQLPPPSGKGQCNEALLFRTLPDVNTTVQGMSMMWLLSKQYPDFVRLGEYPEGHFSEDAPCRLIKTFQAELKAFSQSVKARNSGLDVPYTYLDPELIENSVAL
ncbi:polyunsaturated fatty acid lipoxygenase ALOX15B-like [Osmerus mordax]|uniref:polyunsaturated fatty acid lipoxygenase ALOX15B-like n=1 Tax=Osmerus mordax TaxID=8014 RepID=UPI0035103703